MKRQSPHLRAFGDALHSRPICTSECTWDEIFCSILSEEMVECSLNVLEGDRMTRDFKFSEIFGRTFFNVLQGEVGTFSFIELTVSSRLFDVEMVDKPSVDVISSVNI